MNQSVNTLAARFIRLDPFNARGRVQNGAASEWTSVRHDHESHRSPGDWNRKLTDADTPGNNAGTAADTVTTIKCCLAVSVAVYAVLCGHPRQSVQGWLRLTELAAQL